MEIASIESVRAPIASKRTSRLTSQGARDSLHCCSNPPGVTVCGIPSTTMSLMERKPTQHSERVVRCLLVFCKDSNTEATDGSRGGLAAARLI